MVWAEKVCKKSSQRETRDGPMQPNAQAPLARHHAIVTGGSRGIGVAVAEALARLGASISLIGRKAEVLHAEATRLTKEHGAKVATAAVDVTDEAAVHKAVATLRDTLGPPSILVNNAGIAASAGFLKSDAALWRKVLDVNLMGAVYCAQAVLPGMLEAGWGRIVNIASVAGLTGHPYITVYCASKHALIGLTRSLAMETARTNITVNAVCPSYTDTEMTANTIANITRKTDRNSEEALASLVAR